MPFRRAGAHRAPTIGCRDCGRKPEDHHEPHWLFRPILGYRPHWCQRYVEWDPFASAVPPRGSAVSAAPPIEIMVRHA